MNKGFHHAPANWVAMLGGPEGRLVDLSSIIATQVLSARFTYYNQFKLGAQNALSRESLHLPHFYGYKLLPGYDSQGVPIPEGEDGFNERAHTVGSMKLSQIIRSS